MSFWLTLGKDSPAALKQLPHLTDEMVAACETDFGVKFPFSFIQLLKTQNGGPLDNSDFKLEGQGVISVGGICGISPDVEYGRIFPLARCLEPEYMADEIREINEQVGDPNLILPFDSDGHYYYALNFNERGTTGEPSVIYLDIEGGVSHHKITDSFAELLACHYEGDPEAIVRMEEAAQFQIIAEGAYNGKHSANGTSSVSFLWKICSHHSQLIVFAMENWGRGPDDIQFKRSVFHKSSIEFQMRCIRREEAVEQPKGYSLCLEAECREKPMLYQTSQLYKGRWKNDSSSMMFTFVYSSDKTALERTIVAVQESCAGFKS
jgi:hypothetical protein